MTLVPYPRPPVGPLRDIHTYLQKGILSIQDAELLLSKGTRWPLVAIYLNDPKWWRQQTLAMASQPSLPWCITSWNATLHLETSDVNIWVDPGPTAPLPSYAPDLIVVTHAHHDHTAKLSQFSTSYPETPIIMTYKTADILSLQNASNIALQDCLKQRTIRLSFDEDRAIGGVRLKLLPAGHLLGAAMVEITLHEDSILITGDFALRDVGGVTGATWPKKAYNLVIMESTSAQHDSLPVADPEINRRAFLHEVDRILNKGKNRLLVSTQAMAQAQELYAALSLAQQAGAFPNLNVRLARSAATISSEYYNAMKDQIGPWCCPFLTLVQDIVPENSIVIVSTIDSGEGAEKEDQLAKEIRESADGCIINKPIVHTHAGWSELMAWAVGIPCNTVLLYHGFSLSLKTALTETGRKVETLSKEGDVWAVHEGQ